jgi:hypothetical protein
MTNTTWVLNFCNDYATKALWLAELFIYLGLVMGVLMAAAEVYKLYREALAVKPAGAALSGMARAANPAIGEVIKGLVGVLTGAKAWLALVIVGLILLWLAGNMAPAFCTPPEPPPATRTNPPASNTATPASGPARR